MSQPPRRGAVTKVDYRPYSWVQTSGDVEQDSVYVVGLANRELRLREMRRLAHHHGRQYGEKVEKRVFQIWVEREKRNEIISKQRESIYELETECATN